MADYSKENFRHKPTCRLINSCKPELGKVRNKIVENTNHNVRATTNMNQFFFFFFLRGGGGGGGDTNDLLPVFKY